jgi:hypothetical protein
MRFLLKYGCGVLFCFSCTIAIFIAIDIAKDLTENNIRASNIGKLFISLFVADFSFCQARKLSKGFWRVPNKTQ